MIFNSKIGFNCLFLAERSMLAVRPILAANEEDIKEVFRKGG